MILLSVLFLTGDCSIDSSAIEDLLRKSWEGTYSNTERRGKMMRPSLLNFVIA